MEKIELIRAILDVSSKYEDSPTIESEDNLPGVFDNAIGSYVLVRCKDAGVHAGFLRSATGRSCFLEKSRRLWYWEPSDDSSFLSGVAKYGLTDKSKVGVEIDIILTENCEIMICSKEAQASISSKIAYKA